MHHLISCLLNVGGGDRFGSRGMRMKDPDQVQPLGIDPIQGLQLLIRIHHKSHRALRLVPYEDDLPDPSIAPGQQAAGFKRDMCCHMLQHLIVLALIENQL